MYVVIRTFFKNVSYGTVCGKFLCQEFCYNLRTFYASSSPLIRGIAHQQAPPGSLSQHRR